MTNPAAAFLLETQPQDLPEDVRLEAQRLLLDLIGVAAGGSRTPLSRIIRNHAAAQFGHAAGSGHPAKVWLDGRAVSPVGAALANGMTIDALDAHDGYKPAKGHVGCGVFPAIAAIMQAEGLDDPRQFLTSVILGYEIGSRAGAALHATASDYHTSGAWIAPTCAGLGARLLGLSTAATREALGIAEYHGPRSQMMRCIDHPTMVKDGSGWGAMAGVSAAYLARDGFTGAPAVTFEGPEAATFWADLGARWLMKEQYVKLYPVCRWSQPAVEAVLALQRAHGLDWRKITSIEITSFHEAIRLHVAHPDTSEQAQYSLPFPVAAALVRGRIGAEEVSDAALADPDIRALSAKIELIEDAHCNAAFPERRFARATLRMADGRVVASSGLVEAQGDPENPLPQPVVREKFHTLATPVWGPEMAARVVDLVDGLWSADSLTPLWDVLALAPEADHA
ncbi:MAG: MmgE/PrpD family protein [Rhodobacteraceae bacterium]|nr:MmgE/PrpD family protein [Paracoccaceae bacterium]